MNEIKNLKLDAVFLELLQKATFSNQQLETSSRALGDKIENFFLRNLTIIAVKQDNSTEWGNYNLLQDGTLFLGEYDKQKSHEQNLQEGWPVHEIPLKNIKKVFIMLPSSAQIVIFDKKIVTFSTDSDGRVSFVKKEGDLNATDKKRDN